MDQWRDRGRGNSEMNGNLYAYEGDETKWESAKLSELSAAELGWILFKWGKMISEYIGQIQTRDIYVKSDQTANIQILKDQALYFAEIVKNLEKQWTE